MVLHYLQEVKHNLLTTVTLGTKMDENRIDGVTEVGSERFYLHYNFPPFSTGEARPIRGVSRREIGHGNLHKEHFKNDRR